MDKMDKNGQNKQYSTTAHNVCFLSELSQVITAATVNHNCNENKQLTSN